MVTCSSFNALQKRPHVDQERASLKRAEKERFTSTFTKEVSTSASWLLTPMDCIYYFNYPPLASVSVLFERTVAT